MYYVSDRRGDYLGVTDTKDNVEEFYSIDELKTFNVEIIRFNKELPLGYKFETKCFKFELIKIDDTEGWKLEFKSGVSVFYNKCSYLGYPVISFKKCFVHYNLSTIDVSGMDTSNVMDMSCMFEECKSITTLDLSSFNISNVTNLCRMFYECESLATLDLSSFNTSNVTDMYGMFLGCHSLTTLDLSNFNTSNVTDLYGMFCGCHSLTTLDLGNFDTSNVTDMFGMFGMFSNSNVRLVKCSNYNVIEQAPNIGLIEASKCETYDKRIKIKRGTKLKDIAPKLCLLIDKGIIAYEEVD